jgi:N-acetylmuramoyl-L-alanine amidase
VKNGEINKPADEESIQAVKAALADQRQLAPGALFFYNPAIDSYQPLARFTSNHACH